MGRATALPFKEKPPHAFLLVDNLPLALALGKGRANSQHLLSTCRSICSLLLATGMRLYARWVPSELNPADEPSRTSQAGSAMGGRGRSSRTSRGRGKPTAVIKSLLKRPASAPTPAKEKASGSNTSGRAAASTSTALVGAHSLKNAPATKKERAAKLRKENAHKRLERFGNQH